MSIRDITDLILAIVALGTFLNTIINSRRVKKVQTDMYVPNGTRNGNRLGQEVHEIRKDLYDLGVLFGSHIVQHAEESGVSFPVQLRDLQDKLSQMPNEAKEHNEHLRHRFNYPKEQE